MTAARMNNGKPMLSFVLQFPTAVEAFARVKELGAVKYERDNWKKGGKPDWEYLDACLRHIMAFMSGEYYADDSGCSHLAHAAWNLFALQELNYPGQSHDPEMFKEMLAKWGEANQPETGHLPRNDSRPLPIQTDLPYNEKEEPRLKFEIKDVEKLDSMKTIDAHLQKFLLQCRHGGGA